HPTQTRSRERVKGGRGSSCARARASGRTPGREVNGRAMSVPLRLIYLRCGERRFVPKAAVSRCSEERSYSITSSARASTVAGTSRPRVFAVFRLITNVFGRGLHRQGGGLLGVEDAVDVARRAAELVDVIWTVGDQASSGYEKPLKVNRRKLVTARDRDN